MDRTTFFKVVRVLLEDPEFGLIANGTGWLASAYLQAIKIELAGTPVHPQVWYFLRLSTVTTGERMNWLESALTELDRRESPVESLRRFAHTVHDMYVRNHPLLEVDTGRDPFVKWFEDDLMHKAIRNMLV